MAEGNMKKARDVLMQYKKIRWLIDDIEQQINELNDRVLSAKAGKITGMPRGGKPVTMEDLIGDKADLISRKLRYEKIAKQKKEIVQSYIDTVVSVKHNRLLTLYFVRCQSIEEIAKAENYTKRHAFRIYHEAIQMVDLSINL